MKTTIGVGISALSALAAQGKDFDRAELNAMRRGSSEDRSPHPIR